MMKEGPPSGESILAKKQKQKQNKQANKNSVSQNIPRKENESCVARARAEGSVARADA